MKLTATQKKKFNRIRRLSQMQRMDPVEFELFTGYLYRKLGYRVSTTADSGDEGIDLVVRRWGRKFVVQCIRYSGTVGQPVARVLYGAMTHVGARGAHLVTTGRISKKAEEWVAGKPIVLVDGNDLVAWVNKTRRGNQKTKIFPAVYPSLIWMLGLLMLIVMITFGVWGYQNPDTVAGVLPVVKTLVADTPTPTPSATPVDLDAEVVATLTPTPIPTPSATLNQGRPSPTPEASE